MQKECSKQKCNLDCYTDENYCILHSQDERKDLNVFIKVLSEAVQAYYTQYSTILFDSIYFPMKFDFNRFLGSISKKPFKKLIIRNCVFQDELSISECNPETIEFEYNFGNKCKLSSLIVNRIILLRSNKFESFEIDQSKIKQLTLISNSPAEIQEEKINKLFIILSDIEAIQISNQVFDTIHFAILQFHGSFYANNIQTNNFLIRDSIFHENANLVEFECSKTFYLKNCIFMKPDLIAISNSDLSNSGFRGTDVSKIQFLDNSWKSKNEKKIRILDQRLAETRCAYDNSDLPYIKVSPIECAETYRQLKVNYESKGNYIDAGDFHYGEMEMRRISESGFLNIFSINTIYKTLSGYGEQPFKSIIIFMLSIFVLSSIQLLSGFEINGTVINYDIQLSNSPKLFSLYDYLASIKLTFGNLTLRNIPKTNMIHSNINTLLWIFETLFGPLQLALIVLAVKRKVKR